MSDKYKISYISMDIFMTGVFIGLAIVGYEAVIWLKTGIWTNITIYNIIRLFNIDLFSLVNKIEWVGVRKAVLWVLDLPLMFFPMALGAFLGRLFQVAFTDEE